MFKDLRRTFATMCALRGVQPKALQNWMGHESITTTMKYYVISPEDHDQEEIKRLDGMSGGHLYGHHGKMRKEENAGKALKE